MALISCVEISGRPGTSAGFFETELTRTWRLRVDDRQDNVYAIMQTLARNGVLPVQFAPHPHNTYATCRRLAVNDDASGYVYTITANYSAQPLSQDEKQRAETPNPLDRSPRRWVEAYEYKRYTNKDRDGNVIANSAGTPYPEPAEKDATDLIVQVRQNVTEWPEWPELYNNKLNENELIIRPTAINAPRTWAAETVLFKYQGCSEPMEENGYLFCEISYRLHYSANGWQDSRVDRGFYYKDGSTLKRAQVDGADSVEEVPLDGSGAILTDPTAETLVTNDFDVIEVVDMTELAILNT